MNGPESLHCPSCGYNLTGLPENRCPECGRTFDPAAVRRSLALRAPKAYVRSAIQTVLVPLVACVLVRILYVQVRASAELWFLILLVVLLGNSIWLSVVLQSASCPNNSYASLRSGLIVVVSTFGFFLIHAAFLIVGVWIADTALGL